MPTDGLPPSVFFGSPGFAVPSLMAVMRVSDVRLVVTQPDRRAGRGRRLTSTPVKETALRAGIEVVEPRSPKDQTFVERLEKAGAAFFFVTAYGNILPAEVLRIPPMGSINLHASLLPRHRGAAPVQRAIIEGDRVTGLTLMRMDEGMDTGPVIARTEVDIADTDTAQDLFCKLESASGPFIERELVKYLRGELEPVEQDHAAATMAPRLSKQDGDIDWSRPAIEIANLVRGLTPWPGARSWIEGQPMCIRGARLPLPGEEPPPEDAPGTLFSADGSMRVRCGRGWLVITRIQAPGRRELDAAQFLRGCDPGPRCVFGKPG